MGASDDPPPLRDEPPLSGEITRLRTEVDRLQRMLGPNQDLAVEILGHKVYAIALRRLTRFWGVVATVVGLVGIGFVADVYLKVTDYVESAGRARLDKLLATESKKLQEATAQQLADLRSSTDAQVAATLADLQTRLDRMREEMNATVARGVEDALAGVRRSATESERAIREAQARVDERSRALLASVERDATRVSQLARAAQPVTVTAGTAEGPSGGEGCPALVAAHRDRVTVRRTVQRTRYVGRWWARNTFSVVVGTRGGFPVAPEAENCVLNAIDRVVYRLDERWFTPSEVVRADPADRFRMSVEVWGPTPVTARLYFEDGPEPLERVGAFSTLEGEGRFRAPGEPPAVPDGGVGGT